MISNAFTNPIMEEKLNDKHATLEIDYFNCKTKGNDKTLWLINNKHKLFVYNPK